MQHVQRPPRGSWRLAILVGGIAAIAAYAISAELFALAEARTYAFFGSRSQKMSLVEFLFWPEGWNRRWTSMLVFRWHYDAFGPSSQALNLLQSVWIGLCALLALVHTRQITGRWSIACGSVAIWLLSGPTLNAVLWQATQHDKLAMGLTLLTLIVAHAALVRRRSFVVSALLALLLPFLSALAFQAKEISFLLPAALLALALHLGLTQPAFAWRRALLLLLPQLAYSAWFIRTYFANLDPKWSRYALQGEIGANLVAFGEHALNLGNFMGLRKPGGATELLEVAILGYRVVGVLLAALIAFAILRRIAPALRADRARVLAFLRAHSACWYFAILTVLVVAAASRTSVQSAFYLLQAMWSAGALLLLCLLRLARNLPRPSWTFAALVALTMVPYVLSYLVHFLPEGAATRLRRDSQNLCASFDVLAPFLDPLQVRTLRIVLTDTPDAEYYFFVDAKPNPILHQDLGPWLLRAPGLLAHVEVWKPSAFQPAQAEFFRALLAAPPALQALTQELPGDLTVFLGPDYRLQRALFEGRDLPISSLAKG